MFDWNPSSSTGMNEGVTCPALGFFLPTPSFLFSPGNTRFKDWLHKNAHASHNSFVPDWWRGRIPIKHWLTKSNPKINSSKPRDNNVLPVKTPPAVVHKSILLCDSNGKFLDKRKRFPPREDFTFCRSPTITQVRTILDCDEINQESGHPQLILIHSGTNDLTLATPIDDFISDISVLITQASTMFPKSKIIYSTLLPRADIPPPTVSKINMKLIDSLSTQPNVHHLVTAVRGRANTKTLRSSQIRSPPSTSRLLYTTPMEVPGFLSHTVKNSQTRAYPTPRTQQPPPLC